MDWTKAKTILIIALLATNLFLVYSYYERHDDQNNVTNEDVLLQILSERSIVLETDIPSEHPSRRVLHGEYLYVDQHDIYAVAKTMPQVTVQDEEHYKAAAADYLEYLGLMNDDTVYSEYISYTGKVPYDTGIRFINVAEGLRVVDNFYEVYFRDGYLTDMDYHWLMRSDSTAKKAETISAAVALMSVKNPHPEKDLVITDIEMVYKLPDTDMEIGETVSDTAFPAWKFATEEGQEYFIEAI